MNGLLRVETAIIVRFSKHNLGLKLSIISDMRLQIRRSIPRSRLSS